MGPRDFAVLGFARRPMAVEQFRESAREWAARFSRLELDRECWRDFASPPDYLPALDQPDRVPPLKTPLEEIQAAPGLQPQLHHFLFMPPPTVPASVLHTCPP